MFKNIIQHTIQVLIDSDKALKDSNNRYHEIKSKKSKSQQRFNDEYMETQSRINEVRNRINSIHNK